MGLQVWLPLTGDLHNQGLSNITLTAGTPAYKTNGKIGSCLDLNSRVNFTCAALNGLTTFSVAFWAKVNQDSSLSTAWVDIMELTDQKADNSATGQLRWETCYGSNYETRGISYHDNATYAITNFTVVSGSDPVTTKGIWEHLALVVTPEKVVVYRQGILKAIYNSNGGHLTGAFWLGETGKINGELNDVRIYDHALSAKEVEEISKGLVLHYPLNNNGMGYANNILTGTYYNSYLAGGSVTTTASNAAGRWTGGSGGNGTFSVVQDDTVPVGRYSWNITNNTSGNRDFQQGNQPYVNGQTYTTSFWAKGNGTCLYRSWNTTDGKAMFTKTWTLTSTWTKYTHTFTASAEMETDSCTFHLGVQGSANISICGMKMELGSTATNYTVAPSEVQMDKIYDCSGYSNNGIITGDLAAVADSPRYDVSTEIANGQYIRLENRPAAALPTDAITVNFWMNCSTWGNPVSCTEGGGWNFENSSGIQFPVYVSGTGYKTANSGVQPSTLLNTWHMITGTFDRTTVKIYIDSVLKKTTDTGTTTGIGYANNFLFIGAEAAGNSTTPANSTYAGKLSDVRIYATALSAAAIKELYDTSASIDKDGNVYARELVD